jgi:hypothetical protein
MATATFRFYEELNDFLAPGRRGRECACPCAPAASVGSVISALGVPQAEIEVVLVNGESVGFDRMLQDGDRVSVYPKFEAWDVTPLLRVRERVLRTTRFIADAHLGALARLLRLLGFDTLYEPALGGAHLGELAQLARAQQRIVLTRDRGLLRRGGVTHGCTVSAADPRQQLREVFDRLDLARAARPFTRCLCCNAPLRALQPEQVAGRVPPGVLERCWRFGACDACGRVFWEGSHWRHMRDLVDTLLATTAH